VLSVATIKDPRYLENTVATSAEEYRAMGGESPGRYLGAEAAQQGLTGHAVEGDLTALMRGQLPNGDLLRTPSKAVLARGQTPVSGFDLTFSATKDISVLYALSPPDVQGQIVEALTASVDAGMKYIEDSAACVQHGRNGTDKEPVKLIGVGYQHRTNRSHDIHLHVHVAVPNVGWSERTQEWRALDSYQFWQAANTAGRLAESHLRHELHERLGVDFGPVHNGSAYMVRVPDGVRSEFSRRRQIEEYAIEHQGREITIGGPASNNEVVVASRRAKTPVRDHEQWLGDHQARAAEHGLGRDEVDTLVQDVRGHVRETVVVTLPPGFHEHLASAAGLTSDRNTFDHRDALRRHTDAFPNGVSATVARELTTDFLASPLVERTHNGRYTTMELVECERRLIDAATSRTDRAAGISPAVLDRVADAYTLNDGQRRIVERLGEDRYPIRIVQSYAGVGKTHTIGAMGAAYREAKLETMAVAPQHTGRIELEAAGMDARTVDSLAYRVRHGRTLPAVLLVDEASMAKTRDMSTIFEAAQRDGTIVEIVGDWEQLQAVGAGGWMKALGDRLGCETLDEVVRQRDRREISRLAKIHDDGDARPWLNAALKGDRLRRSDLDAVVTAWRSDVNELGVKDVAMATPINSDRHELNRRAREALEMRDEQTFGSRGFAVGDRAIATSTDWGVGVYNGTRGTIAALDDEGAVLQRDAGGTVHLPAGYCAEHLEHGYAFTIHKEQGVTCERMHVAATADSLAHELGYVALSRSKDPPVLHVLANPARERDEYAPAADKHDLTDRQLVDRIAKKMRESRSEELAIDQLADRPGGVRDLSDQGLLQPAVRADGVRDLSDQALRQLADEGRGPRSTLRQIAALEQERDREDGQAAWREQRATDREDHADGLPAWKRAAKRADREQAEKERGFAAAHAGRRDEHAAKLEPLTLQAESGHYHSRVRLADEARHELDRRERDREPQQLDRGCQRDLGRELDLGRAGGLGRAVDRPGRGWERDLGDDFGLGR
jgi:conjugative relaxase-like TrwC/TraI family protein